MPVAGPRPTPSIRTGPGSRITTLLVVVVLLAASITGCGGGTADPPRLVVDLVGDHFTLALSESSEDLAVDHDVQIRPVSVQGDTVEAGGPWEDLDAGPHGQVTADGLEDHGHYQFRFRDHPAEGDPGSWSDPVTRLFVETSLPVVRIDTDDGKPIAGGKRPARDTTFTLEVADDPAASFSTDAEVRGRGNTTWAYVPEKKSYQVTFDEKRKPLGLPAAKKFVLLANFFDRSQLRTDVGMDLARMTELAWTPQFHWVEVILDGDYRGLYQLGEKVDVDARKVDIDPPGPEVTSGEELTGGYLLQMGELNDADDEDEDEDGDGEDVDRDARPPAKYAWTTPRGVPLHVQRPKKKNSNDEQFAYIRDHVDTFEDVLFSPDWTDPETGYAHYLDVTSFIDYWIVQELLTNIDAFIGSTYFYKKRGDPKLYFGPLWDLDVSMGSEYGYLESTPLGWHTIHPDIAPNNRYRPWVMRLFSDPELVKQVEARWGELAPGFTEIADGIPARELAIHQARQGDLVRWRDDVETRFGHRYGDTLSVDEPAFLRAWLTMRIDWITDELADLADGEPIGDRIPERPVHGPSPEAPG